MALHMTSPIGNVALTASFPVEVLIKSAPANIDTIDALYTWQQILLLTFVYETMLQASVTTP